MRYHFCKYQGTGNDFIILDRKQYPVVLTKGQIQLLCDRRFGIGGDGLIILESTDESDFKMIYYNSDGNEGSMCGNGGRCIVQYAFRQKYIKKETEFDTADGKHHAYIESENSNMVSLLMKDVTEVESTEDFVFVDTGSPHYVTFVNSVDEIAVVTEGRKIRYNERFRQTGTNVNFVQIRNGELYIRTYERGVEDETLSCGTGVTASVIAAVATGRIQNQGECSILTPGGRLNVKYHKSEKGFTGIHLIGPAIFVFEGEINL